MSGLVTIWDKAAGSVAWETQEVIVSGGVEGQPAVREDQPVRRLERLSIDDRSALAWTRPAWAGNLAARLDPAGHGAANFAASWVILQCLDVRPPTGVGEQLSADHDGGVVDLVAGTITYTWTVEPAGDAGAVAAAWTAAGKAAKRRIEAAAEDARLRFLTPGAGKAMTYREKLDEWRRYQTDGAPDPADYPYAVAEAVPRSATIADVMTLWGANINTWVNVVGPAIEALEQKGKLDVDAAVAAQDAAALAAAEAIAFPAPS
jgi:hypothetical protein